VIAHPVPAFGLDRALPSAGQPVQFFDFSYDPGGEGVRRWLWDFGDGTETTVPHPMHRFSRDGDYTVTLTVTTEDGRSASRAQVVAVRTLGALRGSGLTAPTILPFQRRRLP
jgi:PKD domain